MEPAQLEFTYDQKKNFNPEEQSTFIKAFKAYDTNNDQTMDQKEFKQIMIDMGYLKITDEKCAEMLAAQDQNNDGKISWQEFIAMMINLKGSDTSKFGNLIEGSKGRIAVIEGDNASHSYSIEERAAFAKLINMTCEGDEDLKDRLPINPENEDLFHAFDNGVLMCKLLLQVDADCLDARAINNKGNLNVYEINGNLKMGIAAAKGLGIKLIGVDASDFIKKTPHLVLTFVWQALRAIVAKKISLKDTPEIIKLAEEGEELKDLMKLPVETILIRWVNYHLAKAGQERRISNLGKDIADSWALFHVLNQLDKDKCSLNGIDTEDKHDRAKIMIGNGSALGVPEIVGAREIVSGNTKSNTPYVAEIFNTKHGLEELTKEEQEAYDAAGMLDDDIEGSREERAFRLWINSLGLEGVYIDDLFEDCKDGILINKVIDKLKPGSVDWKKIQNPPKNDFSRNINNNTAVDSAKAIGIKLIGVGGTDISKGDKKSILTIVWQLVRMHYLQLIGGKTEDQLAAWANDQVGGKAPSIANLKDKSMANGTFIVNLLAAIEPRAINWDLVTPGETEDDQKNNAKYNMSIARSLGAVMFSVWEDFVNVNPKQMLIFFATMNEIQSQMAAGK